MTPKRGLSQKHGQNYAQMVQNATDVGNKEKGFSRPAQSEEQQAA